MGAGAARPLLAGVVAIVALCAVSVVVIVAATRAGRPAARGTPETPPPPVQPAEAPVGAALAPAASASLPAGLAGQGIPVVVEREVAPPPPPPDTWEAVAVVARPGALGPLGAALGRELNDLQPELAACFDEEAQARHGRQPISVVGDAASQDDAAGTVLLLQLEAGGGQLRIVDAPVEARGGASDGLVACAQRVLRGKVFEVPTGRQAGRHRLLLPLAP